MTTLGHYAPRMGGKRELNLLLRGARSVLRETQEQTATAIGELLDVRWTRSTLGAWSEVW